MLQTVNSDFASARDLMYSLTSGPNYYISYKLACITTISVKYVEARRHMIYVLFSLLETCIISLLYLPYYSTDSTMIYDVPNIKYA